MAYYDEDMDHAKETLEYINKSIPPSGHTRRIIYVKGKIDSERRAALKGLADEVVDIPNVGREGETYLVGVSWPIGRPADLPEPHHQELFKFGCGLHHIRSSRFYSPSQLTEKPHLAWDWVIKARLDMLPHTSHIGFMSLGPYNTHTAGVDVNNNSFPRMADIYSMFRQDFYPPHPVLVSVSLCLQAFMLKHQATWAGQFMVSRKRILDNPLKTYTHLSDLFHAPTDHWIWKEGWGNNEPSNPTLGKSAFVPSGTIRKTLPNIRSCAREDLAGDLRLYRCCHGRRRCMWGGQRTRLFLLGLGSVVRMNRQIDG
jgi:hypothetical protein